MVMREDKLIIPMTYALTVQAEYYVADSRNHRVQVFTAEGKFLRTFGSYGAGRGELNKPRNVAVDSSGFVYVSESENHRVSVFNSEGRFVSSFGQKGRGPGQFYCPHGLAVDDSGVVLCM